LNKTNFLQIKFAKNILKKDFCNSNLVKQENEKIQFNKKYSALFHLKNRTIVSVSGEDSTNFLQSMITNDMKLFEKEQERAAIYGLFLNPKGRVLYDAIIIKSQL